MFVPDLPDDLKLLRDFANSLDVEEDRDELSTPVALTAWLAERGLVSGAEKASAEDLSIARRLRAGLRSTLVAHHGGEVAEAAVAELDEVASLLPLRVAFPDGEPRLIPVAEGVRGALAGLLADVAVAQCTGSWSRLKVCPADDCAWVFYDQSKNASRRWCSMGVCGNRTKVRAYRARSRT